MCVCVGGGGVKPISTYPKPVLLRVPRTQRFRSTSAANRDLSIRKRIQNLYRL